MRSMAGMCCVALLVGGVFAGQPSAHGTERPGQWAITKKRITQRCRTTWRGWTVVRRVEKAVRQNGQADFAQRLGEALDAAGPLEPVEVLRLLRVHAAEFRNRAWAVSDRRKVRKGREAHRISEHYEAMVRLLQGWEKTLEPTLRGICKNWGDNAELETWQSRINKALDDHERQLASPAAQSTERGIVRSLAGVDAVLQDARRQSGVDPSVSAKALDEATAETAKLVALAGRKLRNGPLLGLVEADALRILAGEIESNLFHKAALVSACSMSALGNVRGTLDSPVSAESQEEHSPVPVDAATRFELVNGYVAALEGGHSESARETRKMLQRYLMATWRTDKPSSEELEHKPSQVLERARLIGLERLRLRESLAFGLSQLDDARGDKETSLAGAAEIFRKRVAFASDELPDLTPTSRKELLIKASDLLDRLMLDGSQPHQAVIAVLGTMSELQRCIVGKGTDRELVAGLRSTKEVSAAVSQRLRGAAEREKFQPEQHEEALEQATAYATLFMSEEQARGQVARIAGKGEDKALKDRKKAFEQRWREVTDLVDDFASAQGPIDEPAFIARMERFTERSFIGEPLVTERLIAEHIHSLLRTLFRKDDTLKQLPTINRLGRLLAKLVDRKKGAYKLDDQRDPKTGNTIRDDLIDRVQNLIADEEDKKGEVWRVFLGSELASILDAYSLVALTEQYMELKDQLLNLTAGTVRTYLREQTRRLEAASRDLDNKRRKLDRATRRVNRPHERLSESYAEFDEIRQSVDLALLYAKFAGIVIPEPLRRGIERWSQLADEAANGLPPSQDREDN